MIITVAAIKGGVGKTTLTSCIAATLAYMGKTVLCVDLDHQGDLSAAFGIEKDASSPCVGEILSAPKRQQADLVARGIVKVMEGCHLITPGSQLSSYQVEIEKGLSSESRLNDALTEFLTTTQEYDYILLDTPKGESVLTKNALIASDEVIIPAQTEYFALKNIPELLELISEIADRSNPDVTVAMLIPNKMKQTSLHKSIFAELSEWDIRTQLEHQIEPAWLAPPVRDLTVYAELSAQGMTLFNYSGVKSEHKAPFISIAKHLESLKS